ncbi:MAG: hypothetical protein Q8Q56_04010, partial [Alphaproteobacteria bacterium]|nr:hypothetical protein [Alphaproteobacteria bacterium]
AIENISEEVVLTHEAESSAESADTARDDSALSTRPLQAYIDSLYEEQILAEQAEISRRVAEGSTAGRIRAPKKRGAKHATKTATARVTTSTVVTDSSSEEKAALRREILSRLKERGRTKWRTLARALIAALRNAYSDNAIVIRVTEKGSHFMLHIEGEASSDGVTIIRPHGRADRTLSAGEARGLADNLIDLTFRLMARS